MATTDRPNNRGLGTRDGPETRARILSASRLGTLAGDAQAAFLEIARVEPLVRRARLLEQGAPPKVLVVIGSGRVRLDRASGERVVPLGQRGPGEVIGESYVTGGNAAESAIVVEGGEALFVPLPALRKLAASQVGIRAALIESMLGLQADLERRLESLLLDGVEARLCELLRSAARRWGEPHERGCRIAAAFTHAEIAALIGSTRETVTLLLGRLRRDHLIELERRRVIVLDADGLARRARRVQKAPGEDRDGRPSA